MKLTSKGYVRYNRSDGAKFEHVRVVERVLGRPLRTGARIHHINGVKHDNRTANLVACDSQAYHLLLHARERALDASGNPNYRQCWYCRVWDDPAKMAGRQLHHLQCAAKWQADRRRTNPRAKQPHATDVQCRRGHPWTPATLYVNTKGNRTCRQCANDSKRDKYNQREVSK